MIDLFKKRLLLISGKGGVGKSTICAAIALGAARMRKRVLVVEMDEKERISRLFGHSNAGYEGKIVYPNITIKNIQSTLALDDFIEVQVKPKVLAKQILSSPIYRYFAAAAPGLKEFVTLGKIMLLEDETDGNGEPAYDLIVVDAPATGHGVAFFRVPFAAADTVKVGWVRKQADRIIELITDPRRTSLNIVTLPEEMPVNETVEMCRNVEQRLGIPIGYIIINSVFPQVLKKQSVQVLEAMKERARKNGMKKLSPGERELAAVMFSYFETADRRRELNEYYIEKLKQLLDYQFIRVPFIFAKNFDFALIEQVSSHMLRKRTEDDAR